jgi:hypothetical protein
MYEVAGLDRNAIVAKALSALGKETLSDGASRA